MNMRNVVIGFGFVFSVVFIYRPAAGDIVKPVIQPRVLVDRSHEWLFAYDDLSERMLRPAGFEVVMSDASLNTKAKLAEFDILVELQIVSPFDFSSEEINLIRNYVKNGGNLILIGNPKCPIAKLAQSFGFLLESQEGGLAPLITAKSLQELYGAQQALQIRSVFYSVHGPDSAETLIASRGETPVAEKITFGRGSVICFADNGTYWDFCAQRDRNLRVSNVPTTVALFRCLVPGLQTSSEGPPVMRISGELECNLPGFRIRYSRPVMNRAKDLIDIIPVIAKSVAKRNGTKSPADTLIINLLATGGGGWSGGREIGIESEGDMACKIAVIGHEMTHSWTGPLPATISEGWATMVGERVSEEFGSSVFAQEERKQFQEQQRIAEASGEKLDFSLDPRDSRLFGPSEAKMMWLIEQMESTYGTDFMPRFLRITRALKGNQCPTIPEVLYYFELSAGEDLSLFYKHWNIDYKPPSPVLGEELKKRLYEYVNSLNK